MFKKRKQERESSEDIYHEMKEKIDRCGYDKKNKLSLKNMFWKGKKW